MRVPGLALGGRPEHGRDVVLPFDIGLVGEIEIAAVRLGLPGERGFQVVVSLAAFQIHCALLSRWRGRNARAA